MEVTDRIKQHLATQPVVLFMKGTPDFPQCGFSAQTVAVLKHVGAPFHAVNIFDDLELRVDGKNHVMQVRSASRVGKGDLGVNRKRVEKLRAIFSARQGRAS